MGKSNDFSVLNNKGPVTIVFNAGHQLKAPRNVYIKSIDNRVITIEERSLRGRQIRKIDMEEIRLVSYLGKIIFPQNHPLIGRQAYYY